MQAEILAQLLQDLHSDDEERVLAALAKAGALNYGQLSLLRQVEYLAVHADTDRVRQAALAALDAPIFRYLQQKRQAQYPAAWRAWMLDEIRQWRQDGVLSAAQEAVLLRRYGAFADQRQSRPRAEVEGQPIQPTRQPVSWRERVLSERALAFALYLGAFFVLVALGVLAALQVAWRGPLTLGATIASAALVPWAARRSRMAGIVFFGLSTLLLAVAGRIFFGARADLLWALLWGGLAILWTWGGRYFLSRLLAAAALVAIWLMSWRLGQALPLPAAFWQFVWLLVLAWGARRWYADEAQAALRRLQQAAVPFLGAAIWWHYAFAGQHLRAVFFLTATIAALYRFSLDAELPVWLQRVTVGAASLSLASGGFLLYAWQEGQPNLAYGLLALWAGGLLAWAWMEKISQWRFVLWLTGSLTLFVAWFGCMDEKRWVWATALAALAALGQALQAKKTRTLSVFLAAVFSGLIAWLTPFASRADWLSAGLLIAVPGLWAVDFVPGLRERLDKIRGASLGVQLTGLAAFALGVAFLPLVPLSAWRWLLFILAGGVFAGLAWRLADLAYALGMVALLGGAWFWLQEANGLLAWQAALAASALWLYQKGEWRQAHPAGRLPAYFLALVGVGWAFFLPRQQAAFFAAFYTLLPGLAYVRQRRDGALLAWQAGWLLTVTLGWPDTIWRWGAYPWVWVLAGEALRWRRKPSSAAADWLDEAGFALLGVAGVAALLALMPGGQRQALWTLWLAASSWRLLLPQPRPWRLWLVTLLAALWVEQGLAWLGSGGTAWAWSLMAALWYGAASMASRWRATGPLSWAQAVRWTGAALGLAALGAAYAPGEGGLMPLVPLTVLAAMSTAEALRRGNPLWGYPAAGFYLWAYFELLLWLAADNVQLYTAGVAGAGLVMHYFLRRHGYMRLAWLTGLLAQLILLTTAWAQMLQHDALWYFIALLAEGLLTLAYGVLMRSRSLTGTAALFLLLGGLTVLYGWLHGLNVVVLLGVLGAVLLFLGVYGIQLRDKWLPVMSRLEDWEA